MSPDEVTAALVEWATDTVDALNSGENYEPAKSEAPFPFADAWIADIDYLEFAGEEVPDIQQIQQVQARLYRCKLMVFEDANDHAAAAASLYDIAHTLGQAALADDRLGNRVEAIDHDFSFTFTPPFVRLDEGLEARQLTMSLTVAEAVQPQSA